MRGGIKRVVQTPQPCCLVAAVACFFVGNRLLCICLALLMIEERANQGIKMKRWIGYSTITSLLLAVALGALSKGRGMNGVVYRDW